MKFPVEAVADTALIEVVRISALPAEQGAPYPGRTVAHWTGNEITGAMNLIESLPDGRRHRCGFSPGWSIRAYELSLDLVLFEAAFCFSCHEIRMQGSAVPPALATQFFNAHSAPAQELLALFRAGAGDRAGARSPGRQLSRGAVIGGRTTGTARDR
ncbi:hypothetical protein ACTU45_29770 [Streptomyces sp. 24-1644]|uniref:hypothetical protein n=1 Tax=Streptomyces sp. 24-1644 TaxID=3457315 RepID=UPI003FA77818